jgi:thiol-disulfide isomerase/thioredoxin
MARFPLPRRSASIVLALALMGGSACPVESTPAGAAARSDVPKQAARADDHPRFVVAGSGEVDAVVREAVVAATAEGRRVVVYVGATWCEPCQDFHHAVERGELDGLLAGIRFVEFDSDHDGARLEAAGYGGRLIPRFVLPDAQGRGSEHRTEGGIKGSGAVAHIMERLGPLLASGSPSP